MNSIFTVKWCFFFFNYQVKISIIIINTQRSSKKNSSRSKGKKYNNRYVLSIFISLIVRSWNVHNSQIIKIFMFLSKLNCLFFMSRDWSIAKKIFKIYFELFNFSYLLEIIIILMTILLDARQWWIHSRLIFLPIRYLNQLPHKNIFEGKFFNFMFNPNKWYSNKKGLYVAVNKKSCWKNRVGNMWACD